MEGSNSIFFLKYGSEFAVIFTYKSGRIRALSTYNSRTVLKLFCPDGEKIELISVNSCVEYLVHSVAVFCDGHGKINIHSGK